MHNVTSHRWPSLVRFRPLSSRCIGISLYSIDTSKLVITLLNFITTSSKTKYQEKKSHRRTESMHTWSSAVVTCDTMTEKKKKGSKIDACVRRWPRMSTPPTANHTNHNKYSATARLQSHKQGYVLKINRANRFICGAQIRIQSAD